ncbi:alpha/beta hydrolase [Nocardia transvalensis]|uniref:alpha/beta hydrolase family protein n=1 Tax=Nocardia transvalensis TaxID=37333 RepID=UPI002B4ACF0F|nr:alpha/beta hydrolase [Nocardia transvalensis]
MPPTRTFSYGSDADNVADVYLPADAGAAPLVLLLHGGFWYAGTYDRKITEPVAEALAPLGYVVANVEYRRIGDSGGWPLTFTDVAQAADTLPDLIDHELPGRIDPGRIVYAGHSAGGHLALWAAARHHLPADAPWRTEAPPRVTGVLGLAPAADLAMTHRLGCGRGAAAALIGGGPEEFPDRYAAADPAVLGSLAARALVVHGDQDEDVPIDIARSYCARTGAELIELPGIAHRELIEPASTAWPAVVSALERCAG